jgi:hypothetical protein
MTPEDLLRMQHIVQRDWTPGSHWHIGDLAWQSPSLDDRRFVIWPDRAWASAGRDDHLALHAPPELIGDVLAWFDAQATGPQWCTAMETDTALRSALTTAGYRPAGGPFFRHCVIELDDDLPAPELPPGYRVRATRPGEEAERAAVHRAAWRPDAVGRLQVPPVELTGESGMTTERWRRVTAAWPYRHALDQVVEAPDGTLVASALGWYDEVTRSALLEPVGTDAGHARRGLGAAVSLACLHAMRDAGAGLAVVCPRGDDAYPVPRLLYHRLGFRDAGRTVTYVRN